MKSKYLGYFSQKDLSSKPLSEMVVLIPSGILKKPSRNCQSLDACVFLSFMASLEASERSECLIVAPPVYVFFSDPRVTEELLAKCLIAAIESLGNLGFSSFIIVALEDFSENVARRVAKGLSRVKVIGPKTLGLHGERYVALISGMWREDFSQAEDKCSALFSSEDKRRGIRIWRTIVKEILRRAESLMKHQE